ncbi:MAG: hypothetical protein P8O75_05585 [Gammaproteobacteria bacterium]|jgi:hypothetical protein|nr:hypothetical protein [Gammaproteobacteria bacterium]
MSDELQLSKSLIDDVMKVVVAADERAKDPFIGSQYLSAIVGFVIGTSEAPAKDKKEIVDELAAFMQHVLEDVSGPVEAPAAPAAPIAPPGSAFGIWKPS